MREPYSKDKEREERTRQRAQEHGVDEGIIMGRVGSFGTFRNDILQSNDSQYDPCKQSSDTRE